MIAPKTAKPPAAPEAASPLLVKPPEAARLLAVSPRTLWSLTNCGEIPCVKIGRLVRYLPTDLAAWIDGQKST